MEAADYARILEKYGEIVEAQIRVEGMKAANIERQNNGYALAYDDQAFGIEADNVNAAVLYLKEWG